MMLILCSLSLLLVCLLPAHSVAAALCSDWSAVIFLAVINWPLASFVDAVMAVGRSSENLQAIQFFLCSTQQERLSVEDLTQQERPSVES